MVSIDLEHECLLELLKSSLFDLKPIIPDNINWNKVFDAAKVQCIVPLLVSFVPKEYVNQWLEVSLQSKMHYMQLLYEQDSLVHLFSVNKIQFVILKSVAAAMYYPIPHLRTFGDIDFYVPEDLFDSAKFLLEQNGYQYIDNNARHYEYVKNGISFELHRKYSCDRYKDIDHIILYGISNSCNYVIDNSSFPVLPTYENGLVLLGHIMQHLKASGIGLRQIIDWMMFVHKELDDSVWNNHFKALAVEAGLEKLAITVTYMCKKWLGLPNEITWCNTADDEVADQLLIRILDEGNFGHDRAPNESVKKSLRKEGAFKYLQRTGMIHWSLAQRYAVFKPFAWLYQLCRYAGKGITGLFNGEKVFMNGNNNMSLEELWERLE